MGKKINYLLDTNVLIRFLVGDNSKQLAQAKNWFERAEEGEYKIIVSSIVIAETCFVLESFYQVTRQEIADKLQVFLGQRWLRIPNRQVLLALWPHYLKDFHFVDSYLMSQAKISNSNILTFDIKLKKLKENLK